MSEKLSEVIEKELRFHEGLAKECEQSGTDFGRGRAQGIRDLVSDIRGISLGHRNDQCEKG